MAWVLDVMRNQELEKVFVVSTKTETNLVKTEYRSNEREQLVGTRGMFVPTFFFNEYILIHA